MKFVGQTFTTAVPHSHRIFNDAILSGQEITQAEFEAGQIEHAALVDRLSADVPTTG